MKSLNGGTQFRSCILYLVLCMLLIMLSGCGSSTSSSDSDDSSSSTGSVAFSLVWANSSARAAQFETQAQPPSGDVCEDYGIETIACEITDVSDTVVVSQSWPCNTPGRRGTISCPAGSNMGLKLYGIVSTVRLWEGSASTRFTVVANQTKDVGRVTMEYKGSDDIPPMVTVVSPAEDETGVSLDSVITADFSEDVVAYPLEQGSAFTLMDGTDTVAGSVTYDSSDPYRATFTPDDPLSRTTYTARIATDVQDKHGNEMATEKIWSFTTGVIYYVNKNAAGTGDCLSWENACNHPQDAVYKASSGDKLWVAKGTYTRKFSSDMVLLAMKNGVEIYGGFVAGETNFSNRNWKVNVTILDAQGSRNNPCRVVEGADNARLDGFTITGGYTDGSGGGMYNFQRSPTVVNCTFQNNEADYDGTGMGSGWGGGMYNEISATTVDNCIFTMNLAEYGGGMANEKSVPVIKNCVFEENQALAGGGIQNSQGNPIVLNSTFSGNKADGGGGMDNMNSSPSVENCIFVGNLGVVGAGGMSNLTSSPTVINCVFSNNWWAYGGDSTDGSAIWNSSDSDATIVNSVIWGNLVGTQGYPSASEVAGPAEITYSVLDWSTGRDYLDSSNKRGEDPLFIDPGTWNDNGTDVWYDDYWIEGDYHVQFGSPCIDSADGDQAPPQDKDGNDRYDESSWPNTGVGAIDYADRGAYEYIP